MRRSQPDSSRSEGNGSPKRLRLGLSEGSELKELSKLKEALDSFLCSLEDLEEEVRENRDETFSLYQTARDDLLRLMNHSGDQQDTLVKAVAEKFLTKTLNCRRNVPRLNICERLKAFVSSWYQDVARAYRLQDLEVFENALNINSNDSQFEKGWLYEFIDWRVIPNLSHKQYQTFQAAARKAGLDEMVDWLEKLRGCSTTSGVDLSPFATTLEESMEEINSSLPDWVQQWSVQRDTTQATKPITLGLFAPPGSGKSFIFNKLCGSDISPSEQNVMSVTKIPIVAEYHSESTISVALAVRPSGANDDEVVFKGNFANVQQALRQLDREDRYQGAETVYIRVRVKAGLLQKMNLRLVDLPGYEGEGNTAVEDQQRYFLTGSHQVDILAFVGTRISDFGNVLPVLSRLGFWNCDSLYRIPKLCCLLNEKRNLWKSKVPLVNSQERQEKRFKDMTEKEMNDSLNFQRIDLISRLLMYFSSTEGAPPKDFQRVWCRRISVIPVFVSRSEQGRNLIEERTKNILDRVVGESQFFHSVGSLLSFTERLLFEVKNRKLTTNKMVIGERKTLVKLSKTWKPDPLRKLDEETTARPEKSDIYDVEARINTHFDEELASLAEVAQDDSQERINRAFTILNNVVRKVLDRYADELQRAIIHNMEKWQDVVREADLDNSVKDPVFNDIRNRKNRLTRDINLLFPLSEILNGAAIPTDRQHVGFLERLLDSMMNGGNIDAWLVRKAMKVMRIAVLNGGKKLHAMAKAFDVYGGLCTYKPSSRNFMSPLKEPGCLSKINASQTRLIQCEKMLSMISKALSLHHDSDVRGVSNPLTLGDTNNLPPIQRKVSPIKDTRLNEACPVLVPEDYSLCEEELKEDCPAGLLARVEIKGDSTIVRYGPNKNEVQCELQRLALTTNPAADNGSPVRLHPIFVPSKLRRSKTESGIIPPKLYAEAIVSQGESVDYMVIMVVDGDEERLYYSLLIDPLPDQIKRRIQVISISSPAALPLNVGRKRQVIKLLAESMDLSMYWMVNDDLRDFYEMPPSGSKKLCTMTRALYFGQRVMAHELEVGENGYPTKLSRLLLEAFSACAALQNAERKERLMQKLTDWSDSDRGKRVCWESSALDEAIKELGNEEVMKKLHDLRGERQRRIAQVAFCTPYFARYNKEQSLVMDRKVSHVLDHKMYQCYLMSAAATRGVEILSPQEFYKAYSTQEITELKSLCRKAQVGEYEKIENRERLARSGFKHTDYRFSMDHLKGQKRASFLVTRYIVESCRFPSIVNQESLPITDMRAIELRRDRDASLVTLTARTYDAGDSDTDDEEI